MFVREKKNKSGSVSVQVISKAGGRYKVVKTIGSATSLQDIERLKELARQESTQLSRQPSLFASNEDKQIEQAFALLSNNSIRTVGPELVFGKIYD